MPVMSRCRRPRLLRKISTACRSPSAQPSATYLVQYWTSCSVRRQHGVGWAARLLPGSHEIGPPVRRRGAKLGYLGDRIDAGRLAGDLAAVAERQRHLGFRDDGRAHDDLAALPPLDHVVEIIDAIERAFVAAQHLVDGESARREPSPRAIGEARPDRGCPDAPPPARPPQARFPPSSPAGIRATAAGRRRPLPARSRRP